MYGKINCYVQNIMILNLVMSLDRQSSTAISKKCLGNRLCLHHRTRKYCIVKGIFLGKSSRCFFWLMIFELNIWATEANGEKRKTAGKEERAIANDESSPTVCQSRRFLELLLIWSQLGCHPGELSVIYDHSRNHLLIIRWRRFSTAEFIIFLSLRLFVYYMNRFIVLFSIQIVCKAKKKPSK